MIMTPNFKSRLKVCLIFLMFSTPAANAGFFEDLAKFFNSLQVPPANQVPAASDTKQQEEAEAPGQIDNSSAVTNTQPTVQTKTKPPGQLTQKDLDEMLWLAALQGNDGRIRGLVERGANPLSGTPHGETPMHVAASRGHLKPLIYLANHGGSVNARTKNGWTPLHHAARFGHLQAVKYLLHMGAIPHIRTNDKGRKSPMEMAVDNGYIDIALLFGYRPK